MNEKYYDYIESIRKTEFEREMFLQKKAEYEYLRNKKIQLVGFSLATLGGFILLILELFPSFLSSSFSAVLTTLGLITLPFGTGIILFQYLQNGTFTKISSASNSEQNLRSELQDLRVEILKLRKKSGEPTDSENISRSINNAIDNTLTEDFIKSKIEGFYSEQAIAESKNSNLLNDFDNLGYRINGELTRLRKSANLNLVIGTLTTFIAITALSYEVFKSDFEITDTVKLLTYYLPRLSLIIFIEIFAFFFLKMYKTTLADIKYFNNEKTNIDFKLISLKAAMNSGDPQLIKIMVEELIRTERNFKLGKDESTVEIEKIKNDTNNNQILSQLIQNFRKQE